MTRVRPGQPITSRDEFRVGMIVENYRVGTCKVTQVSDFISYEYIGVMCHTQEEARFVNGDPLRFDNGDYCFFYAEPNATL